MEEIEVKITMNKDLFEKFEKICKEMGMDVSTAINIFVHTVVREKRIPFEIKA